MTAGAALPGQRAGATAGLDGGWSVLGGFDWSANGSRCRRRMLNRRWLAANSAQSLHLGQTLLFLVDAHGDELDHRLSNAQTALEFQDHRAGGLDGEQNVVAVVELAHHVSKLAATHLLDSLHHSAATGNGGGEAGDQLVDILFGRVGPNNEHNLIYTRHQHSFSARASAPANNSQAKRPVPCSWPQFLFSIPCS